VKLHPRSLFGRTAITVALTLLAFMAITLGSLLYFVHIPLAKRYSDDFAAVIVSAAHSLQSVPEEMHEPLRRQLLEDHGLIVAEETTTLGDTGGDVTYHPFFHDALARRAGQDLTVFEAEDQPLVWVDVPAHGKIFRIGFDSGRLGVNPPVALLLVMIAGALLTLAASLLEVRRVVRPLGRLSAAVEKVGHGLIPQPVPESGPEEIAALARALNQMSSDLRQMAENRTVMIAGVSHDLRTPLTRLAIAVEMLDEDSDSDLVRRIRRDLDSMNTLIGQFVQFSQGIEDEMPVQLDLRQILDSLATDFRHDGVEVRLHRNDPPCVYYADPVALERVLTNLLKNAVQYGRGKPVDITLRCSEARVSIEICDRGPGIPAEKLDTVFRPFQRLESARSERTGGSGLGLAIAQQLALKHSWTIQLLPRDGGGTVARLELPVANRFGLILSSCAA